MRPWRSWRCQKESETREAISHVFTVGWVTERSIVVQLSLILRRCVLLLWQRPKSALLSSTASAFDRPAWAAAAMTESVTNMHAGLGLQLDSVHGGGVSKTVVIWATMLLLRQC